MTIALTITHPFVSAIADGGDTSLVQPSNWNATHTAALTLAASRLLGRATGSDGAAEEISLGTGLSFSAGALTLDADLQAWAGVTPSANGQSLVSAANYAAMRALLDLEAGTDFIGIGGGAYTGDVSVPDEAYGSGWNASVEVPTKNAIFDAFQSLVPPPTLVNARWYNPVGLASQGSGGATAANRIYFRLIQIPRDITASDLGCRISTAAAAGKLLQLAIYALNATTGHPTGNALAATGSIAADSAAAVSADITGANVALAAGLYWGAVNSDGAPAMRLPLQTGAAEFYIGSATLTNITGAPVGVPLTLYFDQTYGTWPDMTSNSCTEELSGRGATVYVKAVV